MMNDNVIGRTPGIPAGAPRADDVDETNYLLREIANR